MIMLMNNGVIDGQVDEGGSTNDLGMSNGVVDGQIDSRWMNDYVNG
jgi:hypothetical protein